MKYGRTKTGTIHLFTDNNECLCDLNIKIDKEVSKEYVQLKPFSYCANCQSHISVNHSMRL